jgi:hypothetical protein
VEGRRFRVEGGGTNLDAMAHHGHFVERGLAVENDAIVVLHLPLHDIPIVENLVRLRPHEP